MKVAVVVYIGNNTLPLKNDHQKKEDFEKMIF